MERLPLGLALHPHMMTKEDREFYGLWTKNTDWCIKCGAEHGYICGPCIVCGNNTFTKENPCGKFGLNGKTET